MSGFMDEHERTRQPLVATRWESPRAPVHGVSLHDEGAEVAPLHDPWEEFIGRDMWVEWRDPKNNWPSWRVTGVWESHTGKTGGLVLRAIGYWNSTMRGWYIVPEGADAAHEIEWADIKSIRPMTDEERRPFVRDSRIASANHSATPNSCDGRLGGPDDDHYARLKIQPIEVTEAWAPTWPVGIGYHLGEAIAAIARCGTKGHAVRDLRKASWLLSRAADVVEREP